MRTTHNRRICPLDLASETVISGVPSRQGGWALSGTALLPGFGGVWALVSGLGPGLACESADAGRLSFESICLPGPRFWAPTGAAGLICPAWARGRGSRVRAASGCVPSLN